MDFMKCPRKCHRSHEFLPNYRSKRAVDWGRRRVKVLRSPYFGSFLLLRSSNVEPPKYVILGRLTRPSLTLTCPHSFTQACAYFDISQLFPPIRIHLWQLPRYFGHLYPGLTASSHFRPFLDNFGPFSILSEPKAIISASKLRR